MMFNIKFSCFGGQGNAWSKYVFFFWFDHVNPTEPSQVCKVSSFAILWEAAPALVWVHC